MKLFDEITLRKLEQLTLRADVVRGGVLKGERRSKKHGSSVEFADYREYVRGDDLRRLDWNLYARLGRLFVKLLEDEEDLAVHIVVDSSASMGWPAGTEFNKFDYVRRLAGALGHIALCAGDVLTVGMAGGDERRWGPKRGRQHSLSLWQFLETTKLGERTDLNHSLRSYGGGRRPGLLFLLTDLFSPTGYEAGIQAIQARGYDVVIIHLLSPDEVDPPLWGELRLIDVETGEGAELTLDQATLHDYRVRLDQWREEITTYCHKRQIDYLPITTDQAWEQLILRTLQTHGIVE